MNKRIRAMSTARKNAVGEDCMGRFTLILYRDFRHSDRTEICPFCGARHTHPPGDGHRVSHCADTYEADYVMGSAVVFKNCDGEIFDANDGYIVRTR